MRLWVEKVGHERDHECIEPDRERHVFIGGSCDRRRHEQMTWDLTNHGHEPLVQLRFSDLIAGQLGMGMPMTSTMCRRKTAICFSVSAFIHCDTGSQVNTSFTPTGKTPLPIQSGVARCA